MYLDEMVSLEDHVEEVVVLDVLDPTCVYTFICVEIKTNTETVATPVFQKVETTLVREAFFFYWMEKEYGGAPQVPFFLCIVLRFLSSLLPTL
jgi:hypothetical protein